MYFTGKLRYDRQKIKAHPLIPFFGYAFRSFIKSARKSKDTIIIGGQQGPLVKTFI